MRRATFVLASAVTAAVVAGALLYFHDSLPSSVAIQSAEVEAAQPQQLPSARTEGTPSDSDSDAKEEAVARDQQPSSSSINDQIRRQRRPEPDEATLRAEMRKQATQDIRESYSLLLEHLDVAPEQKKDLEAVLIDMLVEGMWTGTSTFEIRGREIPQQERYERLAAVIGDQKLIEFIALEQNAQAYGETTQIARLMRLKKLPLTEKQRDAVFDIVVEVRARYPYQEPPADIERNSEDWIEHTLAQLDEFDRHVVELAPSVLSPTQVGHLSNAYDFMSQDRHSMVETQRKRRAAGDQTFIKFGWTTPGRWPAEVMRE